MQKNNIVVELAYLTPNKNYLITVLVPCDSCVKDVIGTSGVLEEFEELKFNGEEFSHPVAIFGKKCELNASLNNKDRIEILRPLKLSAMEARKLRALRSKQKAKQ
jgi:putative ubiquitin-RnfH superfamily antitoxin RatB of RatAB toxin-antitoxin module